MVIRSDTVAGSLGCLVLTLALSVSISRVANSQPPKSSPPSKEEVDKQRSDDRARFRPKVKLGVAPVIPLGTPKVITDERAAQIKATILQLSAVESPDFGLSSTLSGSAFLPLPKQTTSYAGLLTNHRLKPSADLRTLVEFGPDALPFLLEALSNQTPTKLKLEHRTAGGAMWLGNELWGNPLNATEAKVLGPMNRNRRAFENQKYIESYSVKIGDVCFVAVGQIVGRGYQAVRYQPTACIVINSPTEDIELLKQVRAIWSSNDARQKLFDSLLLDYATEGVFQGPSLDSWELGSDLQIQSAMRLLYYYPQETAPLIAERLRKLNVERTSNHGDGSPANADELDSFARREVANGARTKDFIRAVSWCSAPQIRDAVRDIFIRTTDVDILRAALLGIEDKDRNLIRDRLQSFLNSLPVVEQGAYGDGYNLLVDLASRLDEDAVPAFGQYLKADTVSRCQSAAYALGKGRSEWRVPILRGLLDDKRSTGRYTYAVSEDDQNRRLPIRVCDVAAESLLVQRPALRFSLHGDHVNLDRQITELRKEVERRGD